MSTRAPFYTSPSWRWPGWRYLRSSSLCSVAASHGDRLPARPRISEDAWDRRVGPGAADAAPDAPDSNDVHAERSAVPFKRSRQCVIRGSFWMQPSGRLWRGEGCEAGG